MKKALIQLVDNTLSNIGMPQLKHPVFYNCPIGLRFEISDPWGDDESFAHFEKAYQKVSDIYNDLQTGFDILRIDIHLDAEDSKEQQLADKQESLHVICSTTGLPSPSEEREIGITLDSGKGEMIPLLQVECYWNLKQLSFHIKDLLMQIILADFPPHGGGNSQFESSVFFFDTNNDLMFHLYDDRGLDLVAKDKNVLYPFYKKYNPWIVGYDRTRIEEIFK